MIVLGIGSLGINLPILIAQLVNFTILLVVLRLVAWGPLIKMLDDRRERIRESLAAAEEMKSKAAESMRQLARMVAGRHAPVSAPKSGLFALPLLKRKAG